MTPTTFVEHVYPSVSTLPENQLKFYIQFSAPMGRGDAYRYIHLLDEAGNPIPLAFLQLTEELWDREAQRFTLFFDPGRIKTGVLPNVRLGLPIREGGKYTLVIDSGWHDSTGRPLKETYRKAFNVGPAERRALDLSAWRIVAPRRATIDPISVEFPKPLDRALLEHEVDVVDSSGKPVDGYVEIDTDETQWSFTPIVRWKPGAYSISVSTVLADLAGNTVDRAFEVDVSEKPRGRQTRTLSFRID